MSDEKGTTNYSFDAAGNVTNDGAHSYGYDSENRVVSVDGGSTASYAYDHQNRRYKKTIGSAVTHCVWQGSQVLAEHNGSTGAVLIDYVYSGSRMIAKVASGSAQYFLSDRLSARLVLDTSSNVIGRQATLPFGEDFGESGTQEKHHFTSYERDSEIGTDYAVNRQYAEGVGRFMSADPYRPSGDLSNPQSANRYVYVLNKPVDFVDPTGLNLAYPDGGWPVSCSLSYGLGYYEGTPMSYFAGFDCGSSGSFSGEGDGKEAATCQLKLLKEGDAVVGGYPDQARVPADFKPNTMAHGGHLSPDAASVPIGERHYYYYFEVQALISSVGSQSDWFFQRRLRRRGWFTYERADGSESERINVDLDDAAESIGSGNFVWDDKGYHYLDNPGAFSYYPVRAADGSTVYRKIKRSNIVWDFTVTGYHTSGGNRDVECNTLTFRLRLRVGEKEPWSFGQ